MEEESKANMEHLRKERELRAQQKLKRHEEIQKKIQERSEKIKYDHKITTARYAEVIRNDLLHKKMER